LYTKTKQKQNEKGFDMYCNIKALEKGKELYQLIKQDIIIKGKTAGGRKERLL
jgi:hypothetical protein